MPPTTIIGIPTIAPTTVRQINAPKITNKRPIVFLIGFKYKAKASKRTPTITTKVSML